MSGASELQGSSLGGSLCRFDAGNSSFDLSTLAINSYYSVKDNRQNQNSGNFTYLINICNDIDPLNLPAYTNNSCLTTVGYNEIQSSGLSPGFQFSNFVSGGPDQCHRLAAPISQSTVQYSLYDLANPSRGLTLTYFGGDACSSTTNRSLKLWLLCDPDPDNIPDTEPIFETNTCFYEIYLRTAAACPMTCPIFTDPSGVRSLCAGHGLCEYDTEIQNSRCFCNRGYEGTDCSVKSVGPPALSPVGGVLIGVGLFLALLLAFLFYLWLRIRSLRLDPAAYSSLRSGPEDEPEEK